MTSVLVVANGPMQRQMAGPSIRCLELSRVLHARGHQVTVALPAPTDLPDQGFPLVVYTADSIVSLARRADVVLVQGYVLRRHPDLAHVHSRIVVDLYDPFPLENLLVFQRAPMERREAEHLESITAIWEQLARGDFFLCSSERQRDFWVGGLTAMNRVNPYTYSEDPTLRNLIDVVPFGIPSVPASSTQRAIRSRVAGVGRDDIVLLWGGGVYNWFDPAILIRAVGRLADRHPRLRLVFMGGAHPEPGINELMWAVPEARRLADELDLTDRFVFFNDTWVPYEARADWLLDADVGVSTHFDHVETRFSFRTRVLDYFWAGLPVICTAGDTIADTVASRELGATVPPEDLDAVVAAIDHMAADRRWRNACSRRVRDFAAALTWETVAEPLVRYCESGAAAADGGWALRGRPFSTIAASLVTPAAMPRSGLRRRLRAAYDRLPLTVRRSRSMRWAVREVRRLRAPRSRPRSRR